MKLLLRERAAPGSHRCARELLHGTLYLRWLEQQRAVYPYLAKIVDVKLERIYPPLESLEGGEVAVLSQCAFSLSEALEELPPGERLGVPLAQGGENHIDVALEHGVGREEKHLARVERVALMVEEVGYALQQDGGLARAGDAPHEERRNVGMPHDLVLLALDGCRDRLQLLAVIVLERREQQRVLYGDGRVKVGVELVFADVELPPEQHLDVDLASVDRV